MEQQTSLIQQTCTHLLAQAHTRSRMTSAWRHACMKTHKSIIRARWNNKKHLFRKHTHIFLYKLTLAHVWRVHESMHAWESVTRARWNNKHHIFNMKKHTHTHLEAHNMNCLVRSFCLFVDRFNFCVKMKSSWVDWTTNTTRSANMHTSACASTRSLTYDECTKACMHENT